MLADYSSPTLDLTDPATFRDLSKPMGALGPKRARQVRPLSKHIAPISSLPSPYLIHIGPAR